MSQESIEKAQAGHKRLADVWDQIRVETGSDDKLRLGCSSMGINPSYGLQSIATVDLLVGVAFAPEEIIYWSDTRLKDEMYRRMCQELVEQLFTILLRRKK